MENFKRIILALIVAVSVPVVACAIQSGQDNSTADVVLQSRQAVAVKAVQGVTDLMKRYETNFRTCEPVHLKQSVDLFGLKMGYQFDINGWVENKCSYYMTGNIGGLGNDIKDVFNIDLPDETLSKIKPVVQCNFTQEQLDIMVDGFIAAQERKLTTKVQAAEGNATSTKEKISPEEEKMMQMLMSGQVCTVPNQEEVMQNMNALFEKLVPSKQSTAPSEDTQIESEVEKPILRQEKPKVNMPSAPQF